MAAFNWSPATFIKKYPNGTVYDRFGIDIEMAKAIAEVLDLKINFVEPPPGKIIDFSPNFIWRGLQFL